MPDEIDIYPSIKTLLAIIGKSLFWGFLIAVAFFVGVIILSFFYPGQFGPVGAALLIFSASINLYAGPFALGTFLAGLCQIRRASTLPIWGSLGYVIFLFLAVLYPAVFLFMHVRFSL